MREKLIVYSMDALVYEDLEYLRTKPNFQKLLGQAAGVLHVRTVYPSLTYPAHISLATGCRPGKHGVVSNTAFKTVDDGKIDWLVSSSAIRCEDLFTAAKRAGCTTASVYWPVMGNHPHIDYLINEYFFPDPQESPKEGFAGFGANQKTLEIVQENLHLFPFDHSKKALSRTNTFDDFINGCTCSLIRSVQPDLMMVHNCYMDSTRHRYGAFSSHNRTCLDILDEWLGDLYQALVDSGTLAHTNFVLLSDHGQMDFVRRIKPNVLLRRGGFIDVDENGLVRDWRAFAQSNGMSFSVYLRNREDAALSEQVLRYLQELQDQEVWGIGQIQTLSEVSSRYGLYGDFSFVVETDGYTAYSDAWNEPLLNPIDLSDYRLGLATHGYQPEKGPQPVFLGSGPAFAPGVFLETGEIIDVAPTLSRILGADMPQAEGHCMHQLLR